uniref:Uncharacterized protein n=1 Tax=Siphoviridae sp. ctk5O4 TaxID=2827921 RepID=A0A8S5SJS1_9CAUD|nr:MAG TPA: hypothetical protein [Siphoviridae sp. ctk5O4]
MIVTINWHQASKSSPNGRLAFFDSITLDR